MGRPRIYSGDEKERRRQAANADYAKHRTERLEQSSATRAKKKVARNKRLRKLYASNPEKYRKIALNTYYNNLGRERKRHNDWRNTKMITDAEWRDSERARCRNKHKQLRIAVFLKLGNKCEQCGCDDQRFFELHHKIPVLRKKTGRQSGWSDAELRKLLKMTDEEAHNYASLDCRNCHGIEEVHKKILQTAVQAKPTYVK